jgi:hypothetical protein
MIHYTLVRRNAVIRRITTDLVSDSGLIRPISYSLSKISRAISAIYLMASVHNIFENTYVIYS